MRMRRKKNLEERLAAVSDILIMPRNEDLNFGSGADTTSLLDLGALFGNDNPIELEIGCGKGQFIRALAAREPNTNFLAVEKIANVIVSACEDSRNDKLVNLRFMCSAAEYLPRFLPRGSVSRLYLNFSCPYPKERYASHRLTSPAFLEIYKEVLAPSAELHQKTDNMHFFEYSIEQLSKAGFVVKSLSLDLHRSGFEGNIITEYESRFASQGLPIYRLEAVLPR